ncbi:MAG: signal peptidase I [Gemmatimonadales bacterium]
MLGLLALSLAVATRLGTRFPQIYFMTGPSMEPTLRAEEYFLVWMPPGELQRGDLVIFRFQDEDGELHVLRRLAGIPGDTVRMEEGALYVNGDLAGWPFQVLRPEARHSPLALVDDLFTWGPWVVPPDSVLLLSDTRDMIGWPDGRFFGFVPWDVIVGKATRTVRGRRLR